MKEEPLYRYYINYLSEMLYSGKISNGYFSLLKISKNKFDEFKYKCENNTSFYKIINRDKKINDIIEDNR
jgi:hypothetical protein